MRTTVGEPGTLAREERLRALPELRDEVSAREIEILQLIADGFRNRDMARTLHLSEETVKTHVHNVLQKMNATSRAHAVAIAFRDGMIV